MKKSILCVGLDVHKETISVAVCDEKGAARSVGTIPNTADAVARQMRRLAEKATLKVCYEAGPCGFVLYRQLADLGHDCVVVAPSLIPQKAGDRVKTDRKDALKLARLLRAGELVAVYVPDEAVESMRDLVRLREQAQADQKRAKNRLSKFMLRTPFRPPVEIKTWSCAHREWLSTVHLEQPAQQHVLRELLSELAHQTERLEQIEAALWTQLGTLPEPMRRSIAALECLHGVAELTAATVMLETCGMSRFEKAPQLFSYAGLVPSEYSTGGPKGRRQGGITKTGNAHLRRVLQEAAWHYRHPPSGGRAVRSRRAGKDPVVVQIAQKAHRRLHHRYWQLVQAGKPAPKAAVAVGRELLGFMWAIEKAALSSGRRS